jgi:hypothetical protein
MSQTANVRSVEALKDFKNTLITYADDARAALSSVQMDIRHTRDWLERDQMAYWKGQVKRRQELVGLARTELHRRRLSQANSDAISDTDQKEALKLAQRKLAEAEEKVEKVKRWIPILQKAISDYNSHAQPLGDRLAGPFENSLALLDRMVAALDAYRALSAPSLPVNAPTKASGADGAGITTAATGTAPESSAEITDGVAEEPSTTPAETTDEAVGATAGRAQA